MGADVQVLRALLKAQEKKVAGLEKLVMKQVEVITAQTKSITSIKVEVDNLVRAVKKVQEILNVLITDYNFRADERLDIIFDFIEKKSKYKM